VAFELDDQAAADRIFAEGRGWVYARYANPTVSGTERFLAELEGAEDAALFASGMSAISTVMLTLSGSGRRVAAQRELYGGTVDLVARVLPALGLEVELRQTNHEGELVEWIQQARGRCDALIINPAALTHSSVAVADALATVEAPVIELHISNIFRREPFRHHSFVSPVARGLICGFGVDGYILALDAAARLIGVREKG